MSGPIKLVTGTTFEPVTRLEAKAWLRVPEEETAEDALVDSLLALAVARVEERTQRSGLVKTFDYYPCAIDDGCPITIPKAPLATVESIRAFGSTEPTDTGGTAMSTSGYYVDTAHEFGRVMPLSAFTYPTGTREINPYIIRFTAGYSTSTTGVPESFKGDIKALVARLYEHRGDEAEIQKALSDYDAAPNVNDLPEWG
jgi:uncharacterized phiE125 gp8 family phage protein